MHRTASVNEYSTRYSEAIMDKQETAKDAWRLQSEANKQGSSGSLDTNKGLNLTLREENFHIYANSIYLERLEAGVAREQARKDLPLSTYTEAYWKIDLHNLFHFLRLRLDPHAQLEIRSYAHVIACIVKELYPVSFEAFLDYQLNAIKLSWQEWQEVLNKHDMVFPAFPNQCKLSEREKKELDDKLKRQSAPFLLESFDVKGLEEYEKENKVV